MKRSLVLLVLSTTGAFAAHPPDAARAARTSTTTSSKVTPALDRTRPYKFTTTGEVAFPRTFCSPNQARSGCIALRCPAGTTDPGYCTRPTLRAICTGKVRVVFRRGPRVVARRTVSVRANCRFRSTATIVRAGRLRVSAGFRGNTYLAPSQATSKPARAGSAARARSTPVHG